MSSLGSILRDLNSAVQVLHHSKSSLSIDEIRSLVTAFSPAVLRVLMTIYSQSYSFYLLADQDGEGLENDTIFREGIVIPEIITILEIVDSVLASAEFRVAIYNADPIEYVRNLAYFRTATLPPQFILQCET